MNWRGEGVDTDGKRLRILVERGGRGSKKRQYSVDGGNEHIAPNVERKRNLDGREEERMRTVVQIHKGLSMYASKLPSTLTMLTIFKVWKGMIT